MPNDELPEEVEALRKVPFFEDLTPEDLDRIARIGQRKRFATGQDIVTKQDVGGGLFVILSGTAEVEAGGKKHTLGPGQFFGEIGLLAGAPRATTVRARTDLQLLAVDRRTFHDLFERSVSTDAGSSRFSAPQLAVIRALL